MAKWKRRDNYPAVHPDKVGPSVAFGVAAVLMILLILWSLIER